jgi:hypothetical protein
MIIPGGERPVAIGAPSPIIRHRFGGNLRAAWSRAFESQPLRTSIPRPDWANLI